MARTARVCDKMSSGRVFFSGKVESVPICFKREEKMRENPNDAAIIKSLAIGVETRAEINPWRQGLRRRGSRGNGMSEDRRGRLG